jgi:hypothetical protein
LRQALDSDLRELSPTSRYHSMSTERTIITQRETGTMLSTWTEYLCVRRIRRGVAIVEICGHEPFCEFDSEDEDGNEIPIPDYYEGKKVFGVDYGYLVGEELGLISDDAEYQFLYTEDELNELMEWINNSGFKLNNDMVASVKKALR